MCYKKAVTYKGCGCCEIGGVSRCILARSRKTHLPCRHIEIRDVELSDRGESICPNCLKRIRHSVRKVFEWMERNGEKSRREF